MKSTLLILLCLCLLPLTAAEKPNVLFIAIDDLNDWIGCLDGHPQVKTPHLDRLAASGTLFYNAHCQAPVCNPSRTSVMTGLRPTTTGIYSLQPFFRTLPAWKDTVSLPDHFEANGYKTMTLGKIYHGRGGTEDFQVVGKRSKLPNRFPKERFVKDTPQPHPLVDWGIWPPRDSDQLDYDTANWAVEQLETPPEDPFFMAVGFFLPHVPLFASQKWWDLYPEAETKLPEMVKNDRADTPRFSWFLHWKLPEPRQKFLIESKQEVNKVRAYLASVSFMDSQIGRVLDALEKSGKKDNTIIVCWSDHGYHLGSKEITGKNTLWDGGTRVPLMFAGPGISRGAVCKRPAELLDIYPTLSEMCGLDGRPSELEGLSLIPQLKDATAPRARPAVTTAGPGNHGVRSETHRYIRYADGSEELYDMVKDPNEFTNLAGDPATKALRQELAKWMPKTNAPPAAGSRSRLVERKPNGDVYWENKLIPADAKIPEFEE